ncbi:MAG: DUF3990 domain-containing protein [Roseburia sp.]|nr:DUF3990 domain-containing protein [Anaeroplasma bactoclasticum]MCM1196366.1 DUF3990 domain-containing protein [Roseburia sp.]MCM1557751.1 DUF3990 domain-containing protein [Anaeroplasma bactoclasticum]
MKLYHGSNHIIRNPQLSLGKHNNDYGRGFYCTENIEIAKEWACKENNNGFVNQYELNIGSLKILDLTDGNYSILNWLALLLKNRDFNIENEISIHAKNYILENFLIDTSEFDVIIGYRADDSYFSYAQAFISNNLPLKRLNEALYLGKLGLQVVLVSNKAFSNLSFVDAEPAAKEIYYTKFHTRDLNARQSYRNDIKNKYNIFEDIFILDILREEMKNDDERIQRIISK